jgi:hypothetical protein
MGGCLGIPGPSKGPSSLVAMFPTIHLVELDLYPLRRIQSQLLAKSHSELCSQTS